MSGCRLVFIGDHLLGTDLNDQSLGDSPYVPAVWDGPLMSGAPQRGEVIQLALSFRALVFRPYMFHKDCRMRIYAHSLAR